MDLYLRSNFENTSYVRRKINVKFCESQHNSVSRCTAHDFFCVSQHSIKILIKIQSCIYFKFSSLNIKKVFEIYFQKQINNSKRCDDNSRQTREKGTKQVIFVVLETI